MRKEEAIDILKSAVAVPKSVKMQRAINEALEMAINAIIEVNTKRERTTEKVDRYISVNELKRKLNVWNMGIEIPRWIIRAIDETPSAKVIIAEERGEKWEN